MPSRSRTWLGLVVVPFMVGLMLGTSMSHPAQSHAGDDTTFFGRWWHPAQIPVIWHFDYNFPSGSGRDRLIDASQTWEAVSSSSLQFDKESDIQGSWVGCQPLEKSVVLWVAIDGEEEILGQTRSCHIAGHLHQLKSFAMRFDLAEPWYSGLSTPPPDDRVDIQALATHEFGHASGVGMLDPDVQLYDYREHLGIDEYGFTLQNEYDNLCVDNPKHTMCPWMFPGAGFSKKPRTTR